MLIQFLAPAFLNVWYVVCPATKIEKTYTYCNITTKHYMKAVNSYIMPFQGLPMIKTSAVIIMKYGSTYIVTSWDNIK